MCQQGPPCNKNNARRGRKPWRNDPSSLARECGPIIKRSAKEYTRIKIAECGYIHFNNAIIFVERKV
jgi:hypothetical protein